MTPGTMKRSSVAELLVAQDPQQRLALRVGCRPVDQLAVGAIGELVGARPRSDLPGRRRRGTCGASSRRATRSRGRCRAWALRGGCPRRCGRGGTTPRRCFRRRGTRSTCRRRRCGSGQASGWPRSVGWRPCRRSDWITGIQDRPVGVGPGGSVAADRRVDDPRVPGPDRRVVQAESFNHAGAEVLHHDIRIGHQVRDDRPDPRRSRC